MTENFSSVLIMNEGKILLSMGSEVEFSIIAFSTEVNDVRESIALTAREFFNVPYLWGGKSFLL